YDSTRADVIDSNCAYTPFVGTGYMEDGEVSSCRVITAPGTYLLTQDIVNNRACMRISNARDLIFDCQGHSIIGPGADDYAETGISITKSENVTVRNCNVSGWYNGIDSYSSDEPSSDVTIENNTLSSNLYSIGLRKNIWNSTVINNKISEGYGSSSRGVYLFLNSSNHLITNNLFEDVSRGVYIGPYYGLENNTIDSNIFRKCSFYINDASHNVISNNIFEYGGIEVSSQGVSENITIYRNSITNYSSQGIT
ncbi:unnamed protein product, partial [marine sediment metagenome]